MNRNQLYSKIIAILICNHITVHSITGDILYYGVAANNCKSDIFIYRDHYSLYFFDIKHIAIHKYVK